MRKCIEYEMQGFRPKGRPKRTQREAVEKDCEACKLNKADAIDHSRWRKLIKDVLMIRMGVVSAHPGRPRQTAVKWLCACLWVLSCISVIAALPAVVWCISVLYVCMFVCLQYFESSLGLSSGESALFVNGLQVDLDVSDAFTLVELLRSESSLMEGLHSLAEQYHLDAVVTQQLLKLDLRDSETMYAVDIRDPAVIVCLTASASHHRS